MIASYTSIERWTSLFSYWLLFRSHQRAGLIFLYSNLLGYKTVTTDRGQFNLKGAILAGTDTDRPPLQYKNWLEADLNLLNL